MRALYLAFAAIAAIILSGNLSQANAAERASVSKLLSSGAPDQARDADTLPPQGKGPLEPYREFRKTVCTGLCSLPFAKVSKDKQLQVAADQLPAAAEQRPCSQRERVRREVEFHRLRQ
jgi:hypothetical protein